MGNTNSNVSIKDTIGVFLFFMHDKIKEERGGILMKTVGLLGGMSYESTLVYYQKINQEIQKIFGGSHSAKILMYSYDYAILEEILVKDQWNLIIDELVDKGLKLKQAGADFIVLCANTMHIVADEVEHQIGLPLLHIAKATRDYALDQNMKKVLLLGTTYTMNSSLYPQLFNEKEIVVITPSPREKAFIHRTIYHELIKGIYSFESKEKFLDIISHYQKENIDGVILGCTEIPLLIKQEDIHVPLLNTLDLHVKSIVQYMVSNE